MKRLLLPVLVSIFMLSCKAGAPKEVLTPEEMKALLKDMHLADAYLSTLNQSDSTRQLASAYYELIYKKHHTNLKSFEKSLRYYSSQPAVLDSMYSQIGREFKKEINQSSLKNRPALEE